MSCISTAVRAQMTASIASGLVQRSQNILGSGYDKETVMKTVAETSLEYADQIIKLIEGEKEDDDS